MKATDSLKSAWRGGVAIAISFLVPTAALTLTVSTANGKDVDHPNILFIIMDDTGIDQLRAFNPDAPTTAPTPVLDTLIKGGVSFTNCWTMPECSPSRSCLFTGRYPLRTGVKSAILSYDLPSSQVSPYETTTPKVLARAGYQSAMVGKFHLAGPDNNPAAYQTPARLGWDYYNGNLQGGPPFIDTTLGGQTADTTLYPSGFPFGPERGACWFQGIRDAVYCDDNRGNGYTGQQCVKLGGIPALTASGAFAKTISEATIKPNFDNYNGYYVWPRVVNNGKGVTQSTSREYMTTAQTDDALQWIKTKSRKSLRGSSKQAANKPWMCTVSYDAIHTPYQAPPANLYPPGFVWPADVPMGNTTAAQIKIVSDLTLYAMDQEIGRLLVGAGLATRKPNGKLDYQPEATNTMIIVMGDNGTYFSSVNAPYNLLRAKATPYQTGVSVPLIISGPLVRKPGRSVEHMVNAVDLFSLFGEIAGLDVRDVVPESHVLDCEPMLPYLRNPEAESIRKYNYTELGSTVPPGVQIWPSVFNIGGSYVGNDFLFPTEQLCVDAGGDWFGPGAPVTYETSCDVRANVYPSMTIQPSEVWAVRNDRYKLVKSVRASCDSNIDPYEFYDLRPKERPSLLNPLHLDNSPNDLLKRPALNPNQNANYVELKAVLNGILKSHSECPGDGNLDRVVDDKDLEGVQKHFGEPSVFDFNNDGTTDVRISIS
ncbi:MAG: sulfatase-like hydrolase/transferase [Luteolibacter sp.]|uniref:sulfatase-like hydrolase/transferase n=1 Tax=Luteolibacter sp. TaxID=1962973 RepID=UPI003266CFBB